ncbi:MAG: hypothetical protein KF696_00230 [Planctomycetes bacterium]|nr:hypothetical protein [Planctomycetota bacterium]MCW8134635.1 hypothetical protein [Planctomycetota bacterium]
MHAPDEKTIEVLNRATRDRPLRARNVVLVALAVVLFLAILGVFSVEAWRQNDLRTAENEVKQAGSDLRHNYAHVTDWKAWYASRIKGRDGSAEFRAWAERHVDPGTDPEPLLDALETHFAGQGAAPANSELEQCVKQTALAYSEGRELLDFDALTGTPDLSKGYPNANVLEPLGAFRRLQSRALALSLLGREADAWKCAELMLELAARLQQPISLVDAIVLSALETTALQTVVQLCLYHAPPQQIAARFPLPMPPDNTLAVAEAEAVYSVQMLNHPDLLQELYSEAGGNRWFSWLAGESGLRDFTDPADVMREYAQWLRVLRELARCAREGKGLPELRDNYGTHLAARPASGRARLALQRSNANLAVAIRLAEAQGTPPAEFAPDGAVYKVRSFMTEGDGTAVWKWEFTDAHKAKFASPYCPLDELFDQPLALRIMPTRR